MSAVDKALEKLAERLEGAILEVRSRFQAGLTETTNALRVTGGRALPLYGTASQLVSNGRGRVTGWSLRETGGTNPAVVRLRSGRDSGGELIFTITVPAGQSSNVCAPAPGISYGDGVYVEVVSGVLEGSVLVGAVD